MAGCVTVFGGTGFIGRHFVTLLLERGVAVRMAVRYPGRVNIAAAPKHRRLSKRIYGTTTASAVRSREQARSSIWSAFSPRPPFRPTALFTSKARAE